MGKSKTLGKIYKLDINSILPSENQPRRFFDERELLSLAESIKRNGLIQPVTVKKSGGSYVLIAGERRLRAMKMLGETEIPAIILDPDDDASMVMTLSENIHRANLDPFETAEAVKAIMEKQNITQDEAAKRLSMSQPALCNKLRLLGLSMMERALIRDSGLTERHARALLRLPGGVARLRAIDIIRNKNLNVSQTEKLVEKMLSGKSRKKPVIFIKDVRIFINTVNKAVDVMRAAGVDAKWERVQSDDFMEFKIKVPLSSAAEKADKKVLAGKTC